MDCLPQQAEQPGPYIDPAPGFRERRYGSGGEAERIELTIGAVPNRAGFSGPEIRKTPCPRASCRREIAQEEPVEKS